MAHTDIAAEAWRQRVKQLKARMAARAREDANDMTEHNLLAALIAETIAETQQTPAVCECCGRETAAGHRAACAKDQAEGEAFAARHGMPWDRPS